MARVAPENSVIHNFLGSTQIFSSAITEVVERHLLEEIAGPGLTLSQFKLLKMVELTEARTIRDVALFLQVSNAAASKAVDKLVRRKLLNRVEGQPDRREISLSLTGTARRLLAAYDGKKEHRLHELFHEFKPEELQRASELLDRLSAGLVNHHSQPDEVCLQCGIYYRERCLVRQLVGRNCFYHDGHKHSGHKPRRKTQSAA